MILISQNVNTNKKYISNLAEDHVVRVKLPSFHATFENSMVRRSEDDSQARFHGPLPTKRSRTSSTVGRLVQ